MSTGMYESVSLVQSRRAQVTVFSVPPVRYTGDAESKFNFFILPLFNDTFDS